MFVFSFPIKWFILHQSDFVFVFSLFCVFVVDLLRYVLSPICCCVFHRQLIVAGSCVLVLSMINFLWFFTLAIIRSNLVQQYATDLES